MKYLRRFLSFMATRLVVFTVVGTLFILAFYLSMNISNVYILLSDGMKMRASVILTREDADQLTNFFTDDYLLSDDTLNIGLSDASPYIYYNVSSFNHDLSLVWMWSWPWEDTAEAVIVEKVPRIVATVYSDYKSMVTDGTISQTPPVWYGGRYSVKLKRVNGQWKIAELTQTQIIVDPTPIPVPPTEPPTT